MAIEQNVTSIRDLDPLLPQNRDYISEGAAHVRLVKQTLKNTFPNVDKPVTFNSDYINMLEDNLDINPGVSIDVKGAAIINSRAATTDSSLVIRSQVTTMINNVIRNQIFRVGCYWITEEGDDPNITMGFGTWVRVSGMIMGAGTFDPPANVIGGQRRVFTAKESGGSVYRDVKEENLPLIDIDAGAALTVSQSGAHRHRIPGVNTIRISIDDISSGVFGQGEGGAVDPYTEEAGTHTHTISGRIRFGRDATNKQAIDIMNPYRVTNVWRRTS